MKKKKRKEFPKLSIYKKKINEITHHIAHTAIIPRLSFHAFETRPMEPGTVNFMSPLD